MFTCANKRFSDNEIALLQRAKGSKLHSIDAVLAAPPNNSWSIVRLHFEGFDIDISNRPTDVIVDEFDTHEEFGLLSVDEAPNEVLDIPEVGTDTTVFAVNEVVDQVTVINDIAEIFGDVTLAPD